MEFTKMKENRKSQKGKFAKNNEKRERREERREINKKNSPLTIHRSPLIYGVLPVLEVLRAGKRRIEKIFVVETAHEERLKEIFLLARKNGVVLQKVQRENLSRLVGNDANHQGVVAFVASADYIDSEEILNEIFQKAETEDKPLVVILDGIEDPRNLGAILRSAECAGASGVFIPERRAVGLTETVVKSSAGATEYVKVAKVPNTNRLIDRLKENNIWVVGTSGEAETNYTDWDWRLPCALVLGSEGKGLHRLVAEKCDALVKIPMRGKIESLNVSVAAGVILFEAVRQRTKVTVNDGR
ncbi:MAG: 23S rRNA (guanosine(2251)-2'-O)-methyltransferase RlmB [Pyrinomonadaceae bacterium]